MTPKVPTPRNLQEAIERGRTERSRAFYAGLHNLTTWITGGKPQAH